MPARTMISARMVCLSGQTVIVACIVCFMSGRAAIVACRDKGMDPTDKMEIRPRSRPEQTGLARRRELASIGVMCGQTNLKNTYEKSWHIFKFLRTAWMDTAAPTWIGGMETTRPAYASE